MSMRPSWVTLVVLHCWTVAAPAWACNVPVFRYALERWKPDVYEAVLFHDGPLTSELQEFVEAMRKTDEAGRALLNLQVTTVNLRDTVNQRNQSLWEDQDDAIPPWLVVRYPAALQLDEPLWSGKAERSTIDRLIHSPARLELTRRLLAGQSVVWVVIDGSTGDQGPVSEKLGRELQRLRTTVKLPDEEAQPGGVLVLPEGQGEGLLSKIPLTIEFSILRVDRNDPNEQMFLATVLRTDPGLQEETGPIVVPVFGRGRALQAFPGVDLDSQTITAATEFLCGACSCSVKSQNPGMDLLLTADWERALALDSTAVAQVAAEIPSDVTETLVPIPRGGEPEAVGPVATTSVGFAPSAASPSPKIMILSAAVVAAVILLIGAGRFYRQRSQVVPPP